MQTGKLFAFADDIVLIFQSEIELTYQINALFSLERTFNLKIHPDKSKFMTNSKTFKNVNVVRGIKRTQKYKYLGFLISTSKTEVLKDAKKNIKKNMSMIRKRLARQSTTVIRAINTAFINSLLIYHFTPLYSAGLISKAEIDSFDGHLKKYQMAIPNDIHSSTINNIMNWSNVPISLTIQRIHERMILGHFPKPPPQLPAKFRRNKQLVMAIDKDTRNLMFATTRGKTVVHYHQQHFCFTHGTYVDKHHLGTCSLISDYGAADKFVTTLKNFRLADTSVQLCSIIVNYYQWL